MGELDLDAAGADLVDERREEVVDAVAGIEGGVDQVDPDRTERVLLAARVLVPEAEVEDDFAGLGARLVLEADPDPGMPWPFPSCGVVATVSAKAKKRVVAPRSAFSRSTSSPYSWSSICSSRCRET